MSLGDFNSSIASQLKESESCVAGNKSREYVLDMWRQCIKLKLYEDAPKSVEKDGECFVAPCKKCKHFKNARNSFSTKIEKDGASLMAHCNKCNHFEKATKIEKDAKSFVSRCKECEHFDKTPFSYSSAARQSAAMFEVRCKKCNAESLMVRRKECNHDFSTKMLKDARCKARAIALEKARDSLIKLVLSKNAPDSFPTKIRKTDESFSLCKARAKVWEMRTDSSKVKHLEKSLNFFPNKKVEDAKSSVARGKALLLETVAYNKEHLSSKSKQDDNGDYDACVVPVRNRYQSEGFHDSLMAKQILLKSLQRKDRFRVISNSVSQALESYSCWRWMLRMPSST
ncbi:hypothetical protein PHJA_000484300 [Phtheirospermum japonicum]|uniref:Uncharacterized protein n=1 Tax=Phtheirospermum japonicum TaxID=374723 RepID=A0A830BDS1_9LAMI|nr:hypothetical protein PHJA_000484300 [Phtheirospermum japonicum]